MTPQGILDPGWVEIQHGRIARVESGTPPARSEGDVDLTGARLLPGFVDVHVHGGGGADMTKGAEDMAAAVAFHRARGTTTTLVSLMAQPVELMCEQLEWAAALTRTGEIAGAHLEGPFLACGALWRAATREPAAARPARAAQVARCGPGLRAHRHRRAGTARRARPDRRARRQRRGRGDRPHRRHLCRGDRRDSGRRDAWRRICSMRCARSSSASRAQRSPRSTPVYTSRW